MLLIRVMYVCSTNYTYPELVHELTVNKCKNKNKPNVAFFIEFLSLFVVC